MPRPVTAADGLLVRAGEDLHLTWQACLFVTHLNRYALTRVYLFRHRSYVRFPT